MGLRRRQNQKKWTQGDGESRNKMTAAQGWMTRRDVPALGKGRRKGLGREAAHEEPLTEVVLMNTKFFTSGLTVTELVRVYCNKMICLSFNSSPYHKLELNLSPFNISFILTCRTCALYVVIRALHWVVGAATCKHFQNSVLLGYCGSVTIPRK
jgi:hypothetical protein